MAKRFVIVVGPPGKRRMWGDACEDNTFHHRESALKHIEEVEKNNSPDQLKSVGWINPKVKEVEVWDNGDPKQTTFPDESHSEAEIKEAFDLIVSEVEIWRDQLTSEEMKRNATPAIEALRFLEDSILALKKTSEARK